MVGLRGVGRLLKTGIKFGVPGGALYYTINAGVWGDPFESRRAVDRGIQYLPPEVAEYRKSIREITRPDFLPPSDYNYGEKWNHLVLTFFPKLCNLPSTVAEYSKKWSLAAYDAIYNAANAPPAPPDECKVLKEEGKKH